MADYPQLDDNLVTPDGQTVPMAPPPAPEPASPPANQPLADADGNPLQIGAEYSGIAFPDVSAAAPEGIKPPEPATTAPYVMAPTSLPPGYSEDGHYTHDWTGFTTGATESLLGLTSKLSDVADALPSLRPSDVLMGPHSSATEEDRQALDLTVKSTQDAIINYTLDNSLHAGTVAPNPNLRAGTAAVAHGLIDPKNLILMAGTGLAALAVPELSLPLGIGFTAATLAPGLDAARAYIQDPSEENLNRLETAAPMAVAGLLAPVAARIAGPALARLASDSVPLDADIASAQLLRLAAPEHDVSLGDLQQARDAAYAQRDAGGTVQERGAAQQRIIALDQEIAARTAPIADSMRPAAEEMATNAGFRVTPDNEPDVNMALTRTVQDWNNKPPVAPGPEQQALYERHVAQQATVLDAVTRAAASNIVALHSTNGGATYNIMGGDQVGPHNEGVWAMELPGSGLVFDGAKELSEADVAQFISQHLDLLRVPTNHVGTWQEAIPLDPNDPLAVQYNSYLGISQTGAFAPILDAATHGGEIAIAHMGGDFRPEYTGHTAESQAALHAERGISVQHIPLSERPYIAGTPTDEPITPNSRQYLNRDGTVVKDSAALDAYLTHIVGPGGNYASEGRRQGFTYLDHDGTGLNLKTDRALSPAMLDTLEKLDPNVAFDVAGRMGEGIEALRLANDGATAAELGIPSIARDYTTKMKIEGVARTVDQQEYLNQVIDKHGGIQNVTHEVLESMHGLQPRRQAPGLDEALTLTNMVPKEGLQWYDTMEAFYDTFGEDARMELNNLMGAFGANRGPVQNFILLARAATITRQLAREGALTKDNFEHKMREADPITAEQRAIAPDDAAYQVRNKATPINDGDINRAFDVVTKGTFNTPTGLKLMEYGAGDPNAMAIDRWVARFWGFDAKDMENPVVVRAIQARTEAIADYLGMSNRAAQAAQYIVARQMPGLSEMLDSTRPTPGWPDSPPNNLWGARNIGELLSDGQGNPPQLQLNADNDAAALIQEAKSAFDDLRQEIQEHGLWYQGRPDFSPPTGGEKILAKTVISKLSAEQAEPLPLSFEEKQAARTEQLQKLSENMARRYDEAAKAAGPDKPVFVDPLVDVNPALRDILADHSVAWFNDVVGNRITQILASLQAENGLTFNGSRIIPTAQTTQASGFSYSHPVEYKGIILTEGIKGLHQLGSEGGPAGIWLGPHAMATEVGASLVGDFGEKMADAVEETAFHEIAHEMDPSHSARHKAIIALLHDNFHDEAFHSLLIQHFNNARDEYHQDAGIIRDYAKDSPRDLPPPTWMLGSASKVPDGVDMDALIDKALIQRQLLGADDALARQQARSAANKAWQQSLQERLAAGIPDGSKGEFIRRAIEAFLARPPATTPRTILPEHAALLEQSSQALQEATSAHAARQSEYNARLEEVRARAQEPQAGAPVVGGITPQHVQALSDARMALFSAQVARAGRQAEYNQKLEEARGQTAAVEPSLLDVQGGADQQLSAGQPRGVPLGGESGSVEGGASRTLPSGRTVGGYRPPPPGSTDLRGGGEGGSPSSFDPAYFLKFLANNAFHYWRNGLLSNPVTHVGYGLVQGANTALDLANVTAAAAIRQALAPFNGRQGSYFKEVGAVIPGYYAGAVGEGLPAIIKTWNENGGTWGTTTTPINNPLGRGADYVLTLPGRAIETEWAAIRATLEGGETARLAMRAAERGYTSTPESPTGRQDIPALPGMPDIEGRFQYLMNNLDKYPELVKTAKDNASTRSFEGPNPVTGILGRISNAPAVIREPVKLIVNLAQPFPRVPPNILIQMFDQGVGAFIRGIGDLASARGKTMPDDQYFHATDAFGKAAVGLILGLTGYGLATAHMARSEAPATAAERNAKPVGWQNQSFQITNPLDGLTLDIPMSVAGNAAFPIMLGATLADLKNNPEHLKASDLSEGIATVMQYAVSTAELLTGLHLVGLATATPTDLEHTAGLLLDSIAKSWVPVGGSSFAHLLEQVMGQVPKEARGPLEAIKSQIPWLADDIPDKTTPLGEPAVPPRGTGLHALVNFLKITEEHDSPVLAEARKLGVGIPSVRSSFGTDLVGKADLSDKELSTLLQARQQTNEALLHLIQQDKGYAHLDTDIAGKKALFENVLNTQDRIHEAQVKPIRERVFGPFDPNAVYEWRVPGMATGPKTDALVKEAKANVAEYEARHIPRPAGDQITLAAQASHTREWTQQQKDVEKAKAAEGLAQMRNAAAAKKAQEQLQAVPTQ